MKMHLAALTLLFLAPITLMPQSAQTPSQDQQTQKRIQKHSQLYQHYEQGPASSTIEEMSKTKNGDIEVDVQTLARDAQYPGQSQEDEDKAKLLSLTGSSDLVVTGTFVSRVSALTSEHKFVFSDWTFVPDSILKDTQQRIKTGSQIIVTRPGGVVAWNGRHFRAKDGGFKEFDTGKSYLLMVRYVPETDSYKATASGSFEITPTGIVSCDTSDPHLPKRLGKSSPFLEEVQIAINSGSQK
jgi:hypothetical protein